MRQALWHCPAYCEVRQGPDCPSMLLLHQEVQTKRFRLTQLVHASVYRAEDALVQVQSTCLMHYEMIGDAGVHVPHVLNRSIFCIHDWDRNGRSPWPAACLACQVHGQSFCLPALGPLERLFGNNRERCYTMDRMFIHDMSLQGLMRCYMDS